MTRRFDLGTKGKALGRGVAVLRLLDVHGDEDHARLPVVLPQKRHRRHQPPHRFVRGPTIRTTDLNVLQDRREAGAGAEAVKLAPTRVGEVAVGAGRVADAAAVARPVAVGGVRVAVEATGPEAAVEGRGAGALGAIATPIAGTEATRTAAALLPAIAGGVPEAGASPLLARQEGFVRGPTPELLLPAEAVHVGAAKRVKQSIKEGHPLAPRGHWADYSYYGVLKERVARSPYL